VEDLTFLDFEVPTC